MHDFAWVYTWKLFWSYHICRHIFRTAYILKTRHIYIYYIYKYAVSFSFNLFYHLSTGPFPDPHTQESRKIFLIQRLYCPSCDSPRSWTEHQSVTTAVKLYKWFTPFPFYHRERKGGGWFLGFFSNFSPWLSIYFRRIRLSNRDLFTLQRCQRSSHGSRFRFLGRTRSRDLNSVEFWRRRSCETFDKVAPRLKTSPQTELSLFS